MSITDELRDAIDALTTQVRKKDGSLICWLEPSPDDFYAIADRIDVEHEDSIVTQYDSLCANIENTHVKLPVDADGTPIHMGDVMECCVPWGGENPFEVRSMRIDSAGWELYDRLGDRCYPNNTYHYKPPTVEDLLKEMLYKAHIWDGLEAAMLPDLIDEYAKKLQLRGENA